MPRQAPAAAAVAALAALAPLAGCGSSSTIDDIPGARVGAMAEQQLEAMHSEIATGTMTCPDLDFTVDASVRCVRVAELSGGRRIQVRGTVSVTSTRDGGKLHVQLDDEVSGYGVTSEYLENDLRPRAHRALGVEPDDVRCPDLEGRAGGSERCTVEVKGKDLVAEVRVVRLVPEEYRTVYRFGSPVFAPRLNPGLPSLLRSIRSGGVSP